MNSARALLAATLIAALPLFGCQVISAIITSPSDSSAGSSRSIAGSFDAISTSSGSGSEPQPKPNTTSYVRDLREYTSVFAKTPGSREDFLRGVARIAEDHGFSDWESQAATPRAIGEGLRDAGLTAAQMDEFVETVGRDKPAAQLALDGYRHPGS